MSWLISTLGPVLAYVVKGALEWLWGTLQRVIEGYVKRKESEKINEKVREDVEKAETPEERQAALDAAARRLGRHP